MISFPRAKDSTSYPAVFHLVLSIDHTSDATGKTPTLTRSKNGGSFNAGTGAVSEIGSGWYSWAGNATDRDTLGPLAVHVTATGCDALDFIIPIVTVDPFAANWGIANVSVGSIANGAIAAASFAANALDAVWSTAARTLTAFSFNVTVGDIVAAALAKFFSQDSGSTYAASVNGSVVKEIASNAATSSATIAAAVQTGMTAQGYTTTRAGYLDTLNGLVQAIWDKATSALTTVGSIGKLIVTNLDAAITSRAAAGVTVTVTSPVTQTGDISIEQGDDYDPDDGTGHTISWTITDGPDLTGATVTFKTRRFSKACDVSGDVVTLTLTAAETASLSPTGGQKYEVEAALANGHIWSLVRGKITVASQIEGA